MNTTKVLSSFGKNPNQLSFQVTRFQRSSENKKSVASLSTVSSSYRYEETFRNSRWGSSNFGTYALAVGVGLGVSYVAISTSSADDKPDYKKIRQEIAAVVQEDLNRGPTLVRLAWHLSGTYSKVDKTGGSDGGHIRHVPESGYGANAGLHLAREWLDKIKKAHPGISYADLYTLAGVVAIEEMGGPKINWRPGRTDASDGKKAAPNGRLPDAAQGPQHIRDIFYRMGFNDREIVALVGAHALGRCHTDRSGYDGPWTKAPTMFSNDYYRELLENTWTLRKWKGPEQYTDPSGELMMLPGDLALIKDPEFKKFVELYAKDEQLWFQDFAKAFQKLEELGCNNLESKGWFSWLWGK